MKVTETKEMFYNNEGELEEMKFTKVMTRMNNAPPLMLQNPPQPKAILPPSSQPFSNQPIPKPRLQSDDAKSNHSSNTHQSHKSNITNKKSMSGQSAFSGSTIVHYDYKKEEIFNWKIWVILAVGVYLLYWMMTGGERKEVENQFSKVEYIEKVNVGKLEMNKGGNITERAIQEKEKRQEKEMEIADKLAQLQSSKLISLYIDQLLINPTHKLSISEFKQMISNKGWNVKSQIWDIFDKMIKNHQGLKFQQKEGELVGEIAIEL